MKMIQQKRHLFLFFAVTSPFMPKGHSQEISLEKPLILLQEKRWEIQENTIIEGNNNIISLSENGTLAIPPQTELTIQNAKIYNGSQLSIHLEGRLVLDNVEIFLCDSNWSFCNGKVIFQNRITLHNNNRCEGREVLLTFKTGAELEIAKNCQLCLEKNSFLQLENQPQSKTKTLLRQLDYQDREQNHFYLACSQIEKKIIDRKGNANLLFIGKEKENAQAKTKIPLNILGPDGKALASEWIESATWQEKPSRSTQKTLKDCGKQK